MHSMLLIGLMILLVLSLLWAVMAARIIYAAIGLALSSALLSLLMFKMSSPLAGVMELSVCAGLITAIFISVISLVKHSTKEEIDIRSRLRWKRYIGLPIAVILLGLVLYIAVPPVDCPMPSLIPETDVRDVFWHLRQADILGQILLLLAGAFGVTVLFKDRIKK